MNAAPSTTATPADSVPPIANVPEIFNLSPLIKFILVPFDSINLLLTTKLVLVFPEYKCAKLLYILDSVNPEIPRNSYVEAT